MSTPFMNLDLPVVSTTVGPTWASELNTALESVDSHDHSSGNGRQVTPSGLNINSDLNFNDNAAICVGSLCMTLLSAVISDQGCLYMVNGDLFFNDTSNNTIQITNAGAVNTTGSGGIGGDYGTGASLIDYSAITNKYTFTDQNGDLAGIIAGCLDTNSRHFYNQTGIAVNTTVTNTDDLYVILVDSDADPTITVSLPLASLGERHLFIKDVGGSTSVVITIDPTGSDTIEGFPDSLTIEVPYGAVHIVSDGSAAWWVL